MKFNTSLVLFAFSAVIAMGLTGCTKKSNKVDISSQLGIASWYGHPFDGRPTASGEIYDMEKMTAAHRTLPLGAVVVVENLVNGKTTQVRINDRGPFVHDRIIDLSHAAAQSISMPGIANVKLTVVSMPPTRDAPTFTVQVGAFSSRADAEALRQQLSSQYGDARLVFRDGDQTWRVLVGLEPTIDGANALVEPLDKRYGQAFVVQSDPQ